MSKHSIDENDNQVLFKRKLFGGVDEEDVLLKMQHLIADQAQKEQSMRQETADAIAKASALEIALNEQKAKNTQAQAVIERLSNQQKAGALDKNGANEYKDRIARLDALLAYIESAKQEIVANGCNELKEQEKKLHEEIDWLKHYKQELEEQISAGFLAMSNELNRKKESRTQAQGALVTAETNDE